MAARLRVEYVTFGSSALSLSPNVIRALHGAAALTVSTTVTVAGSRPVVPAFGDQAGGYALIRALDNAVVVAWGTDPTAVATPVGTANDGKRLQAGEEAAIYVVTGQKISAIEVS